MAKYYPIFLNIQDKKCVVVGGGDVAWRKVCSLKDAGAKVTVVSPEFCPELEKETGIERVRQKYDSKFLKEAALVVASTDDGAVNKMIYSDAVERGILVNVVDKPEFCSFIVPSSVMRGDLCISISTGGASPALARNIREFLEKQFGDEYGEFTKLLSEMRRKILSEIREESVRRDILQRIAGLDMLELVKKKGVLEAKKKMIEIVSEKISKDN
ncbi:MAG: bifunctional precorrin-2 dehydrogenase/sirohydrochlorin ferrochelatase [Candidatus Brocadia sp. AMX2]|uniref:precorrin-2 dehydrogenase n=1 Tax=Candidatus Brocadia sinica JPN1 TaxID=1197129 RepID=A0ABQ0JTG7_9BACT|nr:MULTISPECIES: bifunctional precorrin-2 dehydrogenase/sirohydrochlorin ferrochelatase [Brocadia]KXK30664.1 MAG: siroheme synthase [Candidatus Brocadia sinica]MBC6931946.1 bifunctional precorrin-2 dehydrogenase/sirohydrochlorin ferrochelatase [Candidatus Brocadia sp.]MBL1168289.1 bifunctional precorrin-2 dehydrogenase/sirohydrochlorin ferrochelatase [Candidatus Brocadia sp. AMX1]NOG43583.1 bifunctional precorrin-2 dehydrogenase/sirohydrochlorin ferrochelatase [Planctomycetota bacterium]KAA024